MSLHSLVAFVVAAAILRDASAITQEEKEKIREAVLPFVTECAKEFGISMDTLKAAKEAHSMDGIEPCFIACVFKKTKMIDDSGKFDKAESMARAEKFIHSEADLKKAVQVAEDCESVNDASVSDGDKGCERAKLLAECLHEHKEHEILP